jgi:glycosyltransferase involved in cell wall biosynthesis
MLYPFVSLVIPCYNEAERVPLLFSGLQEFQQAWLGKMEVILVDDGSADDTANAIQTHPIFIALQSEHKIHWMQQKNQGKGAALKAGVQIAKGDFVLTLDADMATRPIELLNWLQLKKTFETNELLIGSRELKTSDVKDLDHRKWIGNVFNFIIQKLTHLTIQDTQCGYKLYHEAIAKTLFENLQTTGWAHDVELLLKAKRMGCQITEMPITWKAIPGSKINIWKDSIIMFFEVLRISRMK